MMSIQEIEENIIADFSMFETWQEKYQYIIDLGKELEPLSDQYKIDVNKVKGCQSNVWLHTEYKDGQVIYYADSDAIITKGMVSLLVKVLSNHSPDEVIHSNLDFIETIGLKNHLSPTRSNGLTSMIKQMKFYAIGYKSQQENAHG